MHNIKEVTLMLCMPISAEDHTAPVVMEPHGDEECFAHLCPGSCSCLIQQGEVL